MTIRIKRIKWALLNILYRRELAEIFSRRERLWQEIEATKSIHAMGTREGLNYTLWKLSGELY